MSFLNNTKYKEIREASKQGNEKALQILQAMRKGASQADLDGLVEAYYNVAPTVTTENVVEQPIVADADSNPIANTEEVKDITEISDEDLAKDFDGLIDEDEELSDLSFSDYLGNKKRDLTRSRKNADYFKAYSPEVRKMYMDNALDKYKNKFNTRLKDIDRNYRDMDNAINGYTKDIDLMLDDEIDLNMDYANKAYDDLVGDETTMHGFSRSWDEDDKNSVENALKELIAKYGKKNVIAALNTLKNDNSNYRDYLNNRIDTSISGYSKKIEDLLK